MVRSIDLGIYGAVSLGQHNNLGVPCAVKVIKKTDEQRQWILDYLDGHNFKGFQVTKHLNISRIFELLEDKKNYYIIAALEANDTQLDGLLSRAHLKFRPTDMASVFKSLLLQ